MNLVPVPLSPNEPRARRVRKLSRYASGPIRITLRSVEVIADRPAVKTETLELPLAEARVAPKRSAGDRSVLLVL